MDWRRLALSLGLGFGLLTGCGSTQTKDGAAEEGERYVDCPEPGPGGLLFWDTVESLVVGQTRPVTPGVASHPGSFEPLPSACLKNLKLSVPDAGVFEQNRYGNYDLVILDTAPLGERISLSATYRGQSIRASFTVFDPERSPLVGYWRQEEGSCPEETLIRELVFAADGTFSVTWEPFESYKDYWGTYEYDIESGQLDLNVKTGNRPPKDVKSGTVLLQDDELTLETASFGRRFKEVDECRAPFR